ncbi:MAG: glycosyltransferase family 2 protein [Bacteroidota bacterium]
MWEIIFWVGITLVLYNFLGYPIIVYCWIKIRKTLFGQETIFSDNYEPDVTFVIPAYNEERWMYDKITNSLALEYPTSKLHFLVVTDGSNDRTNEIIQNYPLPRGVSFRHIFVPERNGKIAAVERIMPEIKTPISVFTDANAMVNSTAIRNIVKHFANPTIGVVSGEKRIYQEQTGDASAAGEGIYWKYESFLKNLDFQFYSVIGAAGELFAIRTELSPQIPRDSIIEDFFLTMTIATKGYRIAYAPDAYAMEGQSASVKEELKRKIRIAAGGFQAVTRLSKLFNIFRYGKLSFQFISRRVFRWFVVPTALPVILVANILLAQSGNPIYQGLLLAQILFYTLALIGFLLEKRQLRLKALFVPYYFCVMHYAVYRGFFRFLKGNQSVLWERAKRA